MNPMLERIAAEKRRETIVGLVLVALVSWALVWGAVWASDKEAENDDKARQEWFDSIAAGTDQ